MRLVVVIPVLNEVQSTASLLSQISALISDSKRWDIHVLYVDGGSTDGTLQVIQEMRCRAPWLHVINQNERNGLGAAYAEGFRFAIDSLDADYVLEFDGDLQHRISDIPALLEEAELGADYVIGSRFVSGGTLPQNWDWRRVFLSKCGNLFAKSLLHLDQISDLTSGFKLSRVRGFLDHFDFSSLLSKRHAYKLHLLYYMVESGARIKEVPIQFDERQAGESKLIKNDILDTLRVVFALASGKHHRYETPLVVGGMSMGQHRPI